MPLTANDLPSRTMHGHCPHETCEKFFQIWSHKAANLSNDLIEYTIHRLQSDRLRFLFQTRNEFTHKENILPICQMSVHFDDDLRRIKEHIRRFCLSTRNVYRHLRSDARIYPKMLINLDQGIMIKICRFIFKTKVLIKIFSKEQQKKSKDNKFEMNDPYKNLIKAFIVLQSNFEILYADILERDFLQNVKTGILIKMPPQLVFFLLSKAVQTLPIILDTSKTIRLIFCALYKLSEPERQAETEAIRQRRLAFGVRGYGSKNQGNEKFKTMNEILKINQSQMTHTSTVPPVKTFSHEKSTNQLRPQTKENSKRIQSPSHTSNRKGSRTRNNHLSPSTHKRSNVSSKKSSTTVQQKNKQTKSPSPKHKKTKKVQSKNKNASTTHSILSNKHTENTKEKFKNTNCNHTQASSDGWTTWLHNATLNLYSVLPSNRTNLNTNPSLPLLTTWASLNRISKI